MWTIVSDINTHEFRKFVRDHVDSSVHAVLGDAADALFKRLERDYRLGLEEIADQPEQFSSALRQILGRSSLYIERYIIRRVYAALRLSLEPDQQLNFARYLERARKTFEATLCLAGLTAMAIQILCSR